MGEHETNIATVGSAIVRRVYGLLFVVILSITVMGFLYFSQQHEISLFEKKANEYHAKTIRLSLEINDELRAMEVWSHEEEHGHAKGLESKNLPRQFTLTDKLYSLGNILETNTNLITSIQDQYKGDVFQSSVYRLIREYERFKVFLGEMSSLRNLELFDNKAEIFLINVKQLQRLHENELSRLRLSILKAQKNNEKYLSFIGVIILLVGLWLVSSFMLNIKSVIREYQSVLLDLGRSREKTETLLQSTDQGIYGMDMAGNCIFANNACIELLGYKNSNELIGKNMHELTHHSYENGDDYPMEDCKLGKAHRAGKQIRCDDEVFWRKDGSHFYVEYSSNPIMEGGAIAGSVVAFSDITERKCIENALSSQHERLEILVDERTQDLRLAKEEAEKASKLKSEFLGRMSHELRTPMNAILGFGQLMQMEDLKAEQEAHMDEIMIAARHLLHLIDEVLDLATIEAGKINLEFEDFSASGLIDECVTNMKPFATEHDVSLSVQMGDCIDIDLRMDRMRTKEVLLNLVSNAIKYNSEQGKVLISCEKIAQGKLRINVVDTGPGIDKEKQFMLFEPFNRLGEEYGDIQGTGVGLSISKNLMELMGGKIGMQSVRSGGSMFWIECNIGHSITQGDSQPSEVMADGEPLLSTQCSVLYVEDNPANMRLIENIISQHTKAKMLAAPTAEMGIELARDMKPDVILMDINLPGMDGYEALSRLRNYPETKDIPVIAISAAARPRDIERGVTAGFQAYLTKPIQVTELLQAIEQITAKIKSGTA